MEQEIRSLIKEAMLQKNKNKLTTYKNILEGAQKLAKGDGNRAVTDSDIVKATKNEIKQLVDLYEYVKKIEDPYKSSEIKEKLEYCDAILPKMASGEDIKNYLISENVEKNMGACMKALKAKFGDALDGKMASAIVKNYIA